LVCQEEARRLAEQRKFLKELPTAQLVKAGWLPKRANSVSRLRNMLQFFGVTSLDARSQIGKEQSALPFASPLCTMWTITLF
jgi:hypothetical protein